MTTWPGRKTRPKERPYEVWDTDDGWTWRVLKKHQADDRAPYARWFCLVTSPYCPEGEMGDVYAADVMRSARLVEVDYDYPVASGTNPGRVEA